MTKTTTGWEIFYGKFVRILVQGLDDPFPKPRDGYIEYVTETHLFLKSDSAVLPKAYALSTIKRLEPREQDGN